MEAVSPVTGNTGLAATPAVKKAESIKDQKSSDFDSLLQGLLQPDRDNTVSEEALFAALVVERISAIKGSEAGEGFKTQLLDAEERTRSAGGRTSYENAARLALQEYQAAGNLTAEEADYIHSEAFDAAQLDGNLDALYDDLGSVNDPTRAVASMEDAIKKASDTLDGFVAGTTQPGSRPLAAGFDASGQPLINPYASGNGAWTTNEALFDSTPADGTSAADLAAQLSAAAPDGKLSAAQLAALLPAGVSLSELELGDEDGGGPYYKAGRAYAAGTSTVHKAEPNNGTWTGGFLFKPVGEHSKKLVVLAPSGPGPQYDVTGVRLKTQDGTLIEEGSHWDPAWGFHTNAARKYNFTRPGSSYPDNMVVEVTLANGATVQYGVGDPSRRWSYS